MGERVKRDIIKINEELCNGCGLCVPACAEGALQIIDGKARLVSEIYCDGLGACLGDCPEGAISIEQREAAPFDEEAVEEYLKSIESKGAAAEANASGGGCACHAEGKEAAQAPQESGEPCGCHQHGGEQSFENFLEEVFSDNKLSQQNHEDAHQHDDEGCPACAALSGEIQREKKEENVSQEEGADIPSELTHWPVKLKLVSPEAAFLKKPHLLVAADCVPFAFGDFHRRFLRDKPLVIGCPKLDDTSLYLKKLVEIFRNYQYKKVTVVNIGIPCCTGLQGLVQKALEEAGSRAQLENIVIGIEGDIKS